MADPNARPEEDEQELTDEDYELMEIWDEPEPEGFEALTTEQFERVTDMMMELALKRRASSQKVED